MCKKNLDKSLKTVCSDYNGYEYPCLVLARYMDIGGEAYNLAFWIGYTNSYNFFRG